MWVDVKASFLSYLNQISTEPTPLADRDVEAFPVCGHLGKVESVVRPAIGLHSDATITVVYVHLQTQVVSVSRLWESRRE